MKKYLKILKNVFALNSVKSIFTDDAHKIVSEKGQEILKIVNHTDTLETSVKQINKSHKNTSSLLYKPEEQQTIEVSITQNEDKIAIDFYSDCGKFGTHEMLDGYVFTPARLLQIFQERDDITEDEL